jgi:hypothetical protein
VTRFVAIAVMDSDFGDAGSSLVVEPVKRVPTVWANPYGRL